MPDFKVVWRRAVYATPTPAQYRVITLALGEYADWATHDKAHPGLRRLAADAGCSTKTVQRAIAAALEHGLIEQTANGHHTSQGQAVASEYKLTLPEASRTPGVPLASGTEKPAGQFGEASRTPGVHPPTPTSTTSTESTSVRTLGEDSGQKLASDESTGSRSSGNEDSSPRAESRSSGTSSTGTSAEGRSAVVNGGNQGTHARKPKRAWCTECIEWIEYPADTTFRQFHPLHEAVTR